LNVNSTELSPFFSRGFRNAAGKQDFFIVHGERSFTRLLRREEMQIDLYQMQCDAGARLLTAGVWTEMTQGL